MMYYGIFAMDSFLRRTALYLRNFLWRISNSAACMEVNVALHFTVFHGLLVSMHGFKKTGSAEK
jgi:hypothetical protein